MRSTHLLLLIQFFDFPCIHSNNEFYEFVGDIIVTWSMQSPVIVIDGEMEDDDFCLRNKWQHLQCVLGSTGIVRHMVSPLYDDISQIPMVLWNQLVCGFILVYVMPGYSHS